MHANGYGVAIICPTGKGCEQHYEEIDGIHIYRYDLPLEAESPKGYAVEYSAALFRYLSPGVESAPQAWF